VSVLTALRRLVPDEGQGAPESATAGITFESLGVAPDLVAVLAEAGITEPTPIQVQTIPDALAGRDITGRARTGSGKTLAFGLPLVEGSSSSRRRKPRSLVLVPTRELATQVAEALTPLVAVRGLWLCPIYGGVSMVRQIRALQAGVDIVIATPGRLNDLIERGEMSVADVRFVVLDEADQMADMGFLPQVQRILDQVEGQPQTLLFSATLDGAVDTLVRSYQHEPARHEVATTSDDTIELKQRFIEVDPSDRVAATVDICASAKRALVFVSTTRGADRLVEAFEEMGLKAGGLHGRLSQSKRERMLDAFAAGRINVLVATNVAARGIHVDGIEAVIHFDPPEDGKVYLHRTGRTARAGADGLVITLVQPEHRYAMLRLLHEIGEQQEIVRMHSGDPRLADLGAWEPPISSAPPPRGRYSVTVPRRAAPSRGGGGFARPSGGRPPGGQSRQPSRGGPPARTGRSSDRGSWR
jgi:superfamily II DNA/RNA helicase